MTGDGSGRQSQLVPAAFGNYCPGAACHPTLASTLHFKGIDSASPAFLFDDLLQRFPGPFMLELPQVTLFCFLQHLIYKFASAQYALIEFLFLPSPSHGQYLRPSTLASDEASAGQLFYRTLINGCLHEPAVFVYCLPAGSAELGQYALNLHPIILCLADDGPVAAPGVLVKLADGFDDAGPDGIEMDVADQSQEVAVFVAEDGFVAVFE